MKLAVYCIAINVEFHDGKAHPLEWKVAAQDVESAFALARVLIRGDVPGNGRKVIQGITKMFDLDGFDIA